MFLEELDNLTFFIRLAREKTGHDLGHRWRVVWFTVTNSLNSATHGAHHVAEKLTSGIFPAIFVSAFRTNTGSSSSFSKYAFTKSSLPAIRWNSRLLRFVEPGVLLRCEKGIQLRLWGAFFVTLNAFRACPSRTNAEFSIGIEEDAWCSYGTVRARHLLQ